MDQKEGSKFWFTSGECLRDPLLSMYDQLVSHPLIVAHKAKFAEVEHTMREQLFSLDHHNQWNNPDLDSCCQSTWEVIENKYSWNVNAFLESEVVAHLPTTIPFETRVAIRRLLPMLMLPNNSTCKVANCPCRVESFQISTLPVFVATDFDGTYGQKVDPMPPQKPRCVISGRTFEEYDKTIMQVASKIPVYIRGSGRVGDGVHAGEFKAYMINLLGVTHFLEDNADQIKIIRERCPHVVICKVES